MTTTSVTARASRLRGARALFTGRAGGVSTGPHASLDLARHVGDDDAAVTENRRRVSAEIGAPLVFVDQVHGTEVVTVGEGRTDAPVRTADALVTARADVALAIMVADCMPVLLVDPEGGVVGAAHAGRGGLLAGVLQETVRAMERLGASTGRIAAEIGPSACGACYEVPAGMRAEAAAILPSVAATTSRGTPSLDLRAGAVSALEAAGVDPSRVLADAPCTIEDPAYFSYRRSQVTGRFAGIIRLEG